MATLPARPSLDHLRREARNLLRAAQAGDTGAAALLESEHPFVDAALSPETAAPIAGASS